jgi:membrane protein DedA with SNARE-associated domain
MSNTPAVRFYVTSVLSAPAWAAAHLIPGLPFGASPQLAETVGGRFGVMLAERSRHRSVPTWCKRDFCTYLP